MTGVSVERNFAESRPDSAPLNCEKPDTRKAVLSTTQVTKPLDIATWECRPPSTETLEFVRQLEEIKRFIAPGSKSDLALYKHANGVYVLGRERQDLDIGGKANGIVGLADDGYRIPKTLLISRDVFFDAVSDQQGNVFNRNTAIENIKKLLPIIRECLSLAEISELLAIRSSGPEDSKNHTAAGLFRSDFQFLDVSDDQLAGSIVYVLNSAFTRNARCFYEREGLKPEPISLIIQRLSARNQGLNVEFFKEHWSPDYSGVIDTSDPKHVQINVVVGLGTTAVQGVRSTTYLIDRETLKFSMSGGQYREEYIVKDKLGNAAIQPHMREWKYSYGIIRREDKIFDLARAAMSMEKDGMGIDIEFTLLENQPGSRELDIEYLQRRQIKRYQVDFKLPEKSAISSPIESDSLVGQGIAQDRRVFFTEVFYHPKALPFGSPPSAALQEYNAKHPEGYVLVMKFPRGGTPESCMWSWQNMYPYYTYSNAKAIVVLDSQNEGERGMSNESGTGVVLTSHFSQFLRSEGKPMVILPAEKGQRLLSALDARTVESSSGRACGIPAFLRSLFTVPGWKSYLLNSPFIVGADQVKQQGIVGFEVIEP